MIIKPTVGRVVLYRPDGIHGQTLPAIICHVWTDECINIATFDSNGNSFGETSVTLKQDQDIPEWAPRCEWMEYQVGQAAKYETLINSSVKIPKKDDG